MDYRVIMNSNVITRAILNSAKNCRKNKRLKYHGEFIDRQKGYNKLCIILAGYKDLLTQTVFARVKKYIPKDVDVCVITSGLYKENIKNLCEKNEWSYLSTKENHVSLVQNVAISLHPNAEYIYKLDEDIFVTEGYFDKLYEAFKVAQSGKYNVGVIAPLIPINGYGYMRILEKEGLTNTFESMFGKATFGAGPTKVIESSPEVAKFFWGEGGYVLGIDELNKKYSSEAWRIEPCAIRFSIGAILFKRELWESMGFLSVKKYVNPMGLDEIDLCSYCLIYSRPLMVCENVVVGHLSFGPQNKDMMEYYKAHISDFEVKDI